VGLALSAVIAAEGCGAACTQPLVVGPTVMVVDKKTSKPICDATVIVTGENLQGTPTADASSALATSVVDSGVDGSAPLRVQAGSDASHQTCKYETGITPGVFTLQVSAAGYLPETVTNVYAATVCLSAHDPVPPSQEVVVYLETGS
jgi:hypothetical protein